ncbi:MAG: type II secretion system GspH family protein [bacterium]|nr:type II secretion system GspH family protein [bacterium]
MMIYPKYQQKGFTILEVLIAVIIVGVLVAVAVSRYTQRSDEAKYATARSEMMQLVKAEQAVELDTGYYVSLRVLNDVHSTIPSNNTMGWIEYAIEYEYGYAIETSGAYSLTKTNANLAGEWQGPYIQFKQKGPKSNLLGVYTNDNTPEETMPLSETKYGIPLDPWGSPYRLFGPDNVARDNRYPFNYGVKEVDPPLTGALDRFAILSYGKNTTLDFNPLTGYLGDDIIVYF